MSRRLTGLNVFDQSIERLAALYRVGHRLVVSFSAGKDSGVCMELAILAARQTGRLPVEVIMRDEEIMFPGTFEYALRVAARPEVKFHWIYANQPIINAFNRDMPYFWVFDPLLPPDQWVRQPPEIAYRIPGQNIDSMTIPERFPPAEGKNLFAVIGLRTSESRGRMYGIFSSHGYLTKPNPHGVMNCRPIYDWGDGDIWKAIHDNHWDYNEAYDVMARMGVPRERLRIAPPSMNAAGVQTLGVAMRAWPRWFDKVSHRLPGIRTAAIFGKRSVAPIRRVDETWEQCFYRLCVNDAPGWIRDRSLEAIRILLHAHQGHSNAPLPDVDPCYVCFGNIGSWKKMTEALYLGDPFSQKFSHLPYVEPEFFRVGAGTWGGGKPAW